ncbi:MAG: TorF family putative porin [Hyphomicrobiaceae bacterium]
MSKTKLGTACVAGLFMMATSPAFAGSVKDGPLPEPKREIQISANIGVTTDYVFRGFSQTAQNPALQGGVDVTWKWLYLGMWASNLDFLQVPNAAGTSQVNLASVEIDWYGGVKIPLGPVELDLGLIYYTYPGAYDKVTAGNPAQRELDYLELKAGVSGSLVKDVWTAGLTVFYSPEYTNKTGATWTIEGTTAVTLPKMWIFTPTISGTLGYQTGDDARYQVLVGNGADDYLYWNAGIALAVDKLTLDFRYWDTNIKSNNAGAGFANRFCQGPAFQCDERFVATAKITF